MSSTLLKVVHQLRKTVAVLSEELDASKRSNLDIREELFRLSKRVKSLEQQEVEPSSSEPIDLNDESPTVENDNETDDFEKRCRLLGKHIGGPVHLPADDGGDDEEESMVAATPFTATAPAVPNTEPGARRQRRRYTLRLAPVDTPRDMVCQRPVLKRKNQPCGRLKDNASDKFCRICKIRLANLSISKSRRVTGGVVKTSSA